MKTVYFGTFAALPEGTVFSYYQPCICIGLFRKGETIYDDTGEAIDFFESSIMAQCTNGDAPAVNDIESRWGMFDHDQEFAVYEETDLAAMHVMLRGPKAIILDGRCTIIG